MLPPSGLNLTALLMMLMGISQFQTVYQFEADGVVALYDDLLDQSVEQVRVEAIREVRTALQQVYHLLRLRRCFIPFGDEQLPQAHGRRLKLRWRASREFHPSEDLSKLRTGVSL